MFLSLSLSYTSSNLIKENIIIKFVLFQKKIMLFWKIIGWILLPKGWIFSALKEEKN